MLQSLSQWDYNTTNKKVNSINQHGIWKNPIRLLTDLKVDVSISQPAGTAFIQEVDVFNEEAEERNHNLEEKKTTAVLQSKSMTGTLRCFCVD